MLCIYLAQKKVIYPEFMVVAVANRRKVSWTKNISHKMNKCGIQLLPVFLYLN